MSETLLAQELARMGQRGRLVRVTHNKDLDFNYMYVMRALRQHYTGCEGTLCEAHGGHGLCFGVWIDGPAYDPVVVYYEESELTFLLSGSGDS